MANPFRPRTFPHGTRKGFRVSWLNRQRETQLFMREFAQTHPQFTEIGHGPFNKALCLRSERWNLFVPKITAADVSELCIARVARPAGHVRRAASQDQEMPVTSLSR